jgi:quinoprotein glucose dehydrogenase
MVGTSSSSITIFGTTTCGSTIAVDNQECSRSSRGERWAPLRFERETGKPLFPIEERLSPNNVPGEVTSKTQPFPIRPPALVPQRLTAEEAWGLTEPERNYCRDRIKSLRSEGVFTPPSIEGSLMFPSNAGGMNWSGMSLDPVRGLLITNTNRIAFEVRLIPRDEYNQLRGTKDSKRLKGEFGTQNGTPYGMYREPLRAPSGAPCNPPPWGALTAVDINTGDVKWEVPLGSVGQLSLIPNSARWGSPNFGGSIVTAGGLVFIGAAMDQYPCVRCGDGEAALEGDLPASPQATPMTYQAGGKQFVVIAAGGHAARHEAGRLSHPHVAWRTDDLIVGGAAREPPAEPLIH